MSVGTPPQMPAYFTQSGFRRLSIAEYHKLIDIGILTEDDRVELLDGNMVLKMTHSPPHDISVQKLTKRLVRLTPNGWETRIQLAITLAGSEPEPDGVIARGNEASFVTRHPEARDIGLVIEVSAPSLVVDRTDKGRIYAQSAIPIYWIINVVDRQVEVYTDPRPSDPVPSYASRTDYMPGDSVPFNLDGKLIAMVGVDELLG